jgi:hypothetical protein
MIGDIACQIIPASDVFHGHEAKIAIRLGKA